MKIAVTGAEGRIGARLVARGCAPLVGDVSQAAVMRASIAAVRPDIILHLAAMTNLDWCENKVNETQLLDVNVRGTVNVIDAAHRIPVVVISSDHVFSGSGIFLPTEQSRPSPVNTYGLSKLVAEASASMYPNARVVRTSLVFSSPWDNKFIPQRSTSDTVSVPTAIRRTFMFVEDFVDALLFYADNVSQMPRMLHISGRKVSNYYDFIRACARTLGIDEKRILPRKEYLTEGFVPRPKRGGLNTDTAKKLGVPLSDYLEGLKRWQKSA